MIQGIIAAAGQASRINGIPKFLLPLTGSDNYLLNRTINILNDSGADLISIGLSDYTYNISKPFIDGLNAQQVKTKTMNETILKLINKDAEIFVCVMPDTYFDNPDGVSKSVEILKKSSAIASINLWKARPSQIGSVGQVEIDSDLVKTVKDKDSSCVFPYVWGTVAWKIELNEYIFPEDPHIGYAVQKAVEDGKKVNYVLNDGSYFDCGTVEQYWKLVNYLTKGIKAE